MSSFWEMMRDSRDQNERSIRNQEVIEAFAEKFNPKPDITTYELAQLLKLLAQASLNTEDDRERNQAVSEGLSRHFDLD